MLWPRDIPATYGSTLWQKWVSSILENTYPPKTNYLHSPKTNKRCSTRPTGGLRHFRLVVMMKVIHPELGALQNMDIIYYQENKSYSGGAKGFFSHLLTTTSYQSEAEGVRRTSLTLISRQQMFVISARNRMCVATHQLRIV